MNNTRSNNYFINKVQKDPDLRAEVEDAQLFIDISMQLYKLRNDKNIKQQELAILAKIPQSNISRLESPGYQGYTLKVLSKVVRALDAKLRIEIVKTSTLTATARHDFLSGSRNMSSLKTPLLETSNENIWGAMSRV
jgi:transcriptional regulator with XRE-family HTH domain